MILTLLLLLLAGSSQMRAQPVAARSFAGIPVTEPGPSLEGRVADITPDPTIQGIIDQVNSNTVATYDQQLAGELPVWVDNSWYTITTRQTYSGVPIQKATSYVGQHMAGLGLDVEYHVWNGSTYPNVIGEITGITHPEQIVIIGAHLDDVSGTPGADDNASGSVATLIAADIFSQYNWDCTMRFAFWTGEEQGLLGSDVYATRSAQMGEDIVGYLNLDMIAYNTIGSSRGIDLIYHPNMPPTQDLALLFSDVVDVYDIDLAPQLLTSLGGGSDHQSFWSQGYTSILAIEDQSDFNPEYHGPGDTPDNNDLSYFTDFVRASIGTFAHMGCLLPPSASLEGTVSNPLGQPVSGALIQAHRTENQVWDTQSMLDGTYQMDLVGGVYTVTAQAPGYMQFTQPGVVVTEELTTTLDITLVVTPTYILTGYVRDAFSGEPLYATVSEVGSPNPPSYTDPATGLYSLALMQGVHTLIAEQPDHYPQTIVVDIQSDQQQDFNLPSICVLVVGDDSTYSSYYTESLDRLGVAYQSTSQIPNLAQMAAYQGVIWLTGDQVTSTLTQPDQDLLADYLDGGGRLLLSGQNIAQDIDGSDFIQDYLHASFVAPDSGLASLSGLGYLDPLTDIFIDGGYGAGNQTSPDVITPVNDGEAVYQYWTYPVPEPTPYGGVAYEGTHRTVFFSFGFEGINRPEDRDMVIAATLDNLGVCAAPEAPQAGFISASAGTAHRIQFTNTSHGTAMMSYTWNFGDGTPASSAANPSHAYTQAGFYTVSLTVASRYGQDTFSTEIFVAYEQYLPGVNK